MPTVTLACQAMATRFEIVLHGENPVALRAAGEEALNEVERLEAQLSLYRPGSEIAHLNARAAHTPTRVSPGLFALLQHAKRLSAATGGTFDITIAPLVRVWGFMGGNGRLPSPDEPARARANVGMHLVQLNADDFTVRFDREGVMLDLGAIGKGYAVEKAAEILREAGMTSALIHGGTSTVYALGQPPETDCWKVAIEKPQSIAVPASAQASIAIIPLRDEALSVSAVRGKFFEADGKVLGHVLDPRTGNPVNNGALLAAVVEPSATETDALSTALLVQGQEGYAAMCRLRPNTRSLLLSESETGFRLDTHGLAPERSR